MSEILRLYPLPAAQVAEIYEDLQLPPQEHEVDSSRPYVLINMVSSLDGRVAIDNKAGGLGGETDRQTMRILRSKADAVMIGAGTLRSEKISLTSEGRRSPEPLAVIVAGSKAPQLENLLGAEADRTIIVVPEDTPVDQRHKLSRQAHILHAPTKSSDRTNLSRTLEEIKDHFQVNTLLVEGGPSLNHSLISQGLADEFFLTLSPKLVGGVDAPSTIQGSYLPEQQRKPQLTSVHQAASELFLRYRLVEETANTNPAKSSFR